MHVGSAGRREEGPAQHNKVIVIVLSAPKSLAGSRYRQQPETTKRNELYPSPRHSSAAARGRPLASNGDFPAAARRRLHRRPARPPHPRQAEAPPRFQRPAPGSGGDRHEHQEAHPPRPPRQALLPPAVGQRRGRSPAGRAQYPVNVKEKKAGKAQYLHVQLQPPREEGRLLHLRRPPRAQHQRAPPRRQGLQADDEECCCRTGLDNTRLQKGSGCQAQSRVRALQQDALFPAEGKQLDS